MEMDFTKRGFFAAMHRKFPYLPGGEATNANDCESVAVGSAGGYRRSQGKSSC
jgi:hypothetical protein